MFLVRQACNLLLSAPWGCLLGEGINKEINTLLKFQISQ